MGCMIDPHASTLDDAPENLRIDRIKSDLRPLDLSRPYRPTAAISAYFSHYGLDFPDARHFFGTFESGPRVLAAHVLIPRNPGGTIYLLHGYLDHSGTFRNLIAACLQHNFAVAIYDLPGHGLSTGERAAIDDFSDYVPVLQDFLSVCGDELPLPFHLIGHSTGCAIGYEYMHQANAIPFAKVVFLAPLVRNAGWRWSVVGYHLAKPFVDALPRLPRDNSSDPAFLAFIERDPLQGRHLSIRFLDALYAWNQRIQDYEVLSKPVLVVQGTDDAIVDWQYNIRFLEDKLDTSKVVLIAGAKHQLANERRPLREKVFRRIFDYLAARARQR